MSAGLSCRPSSTRLGSCGVRPSRRQRAPTLARAVVSLVMAGLTTSCDLFDLTHHESNSGRVLWHVGGPAQFGPPAFDGATAYFLRNDHQVIALDGETGNLRWLASTGGTRQSTYSDAGCLVAAELVVCGDDDIVALHRADGSVAWRYHPPIGFSPGYFPFRERNGVIYAGSQSSGTLYAIDAATGAPRWVSPALSDDTNGVNVLSLSVDDEIVVAAFVRGGHRILGGVVAVDVATGRVRWIANFPQGTGPDATSGGYGTALWSSVVLGSSTDGLIYALDRAEGAIQWTLPRAGPPPPTDPSQGDIRPIIVSGSALLSASVGALAVVEYDLTNHKELWRVPSPEGSSSGSPLAADSAAVYSVHANGHLVAYSIAHPSVLWDAGSYDQAFFATPAVAADRLFVAGVTGFWAIAK